MILLFYRKKQMIFYIPYKLVFIVTVSENQIQIRTKRDKLLQSNLSHHAHT